MDMKKILQALDTASSKPVEGSNDIKKSLAVITEAANPHKVSLPVQMAMSHFQTPAKKIEQKPSLLNKYFKEAEETLAKERAVKEQHYKMYGKKIAERVLMKESVVSEALPLDQLVKLSKFKKELQQQQQAQAPKPGTLSASQQASVDDWERDVAANFAARSSKPSGRFFANREPVAHTPAPAPVAQTEPEQEFQVDPKLNVKQLRYRIQRLDQIAKTIEDIEALRARAEKKWMLPPGLESDLDVELGIPSGKNEQEYDEILAANQRKLKKLKDFVEMKRAVYRKKSTPHYAEGLNEAEGASYEERLQAAQAALPVLQKLQPHINKVVKENHYVFEELQGDLQVLLRTIQESGLAENDAYDMISDINEAIEAAHAANAKMYSIANGLEQTINTTASNIEWFSDEIEDARKGTQ